MIRLEIVPIGEKVRWLEEELRVTTPATIVGRNADNGPLPYVILVLTSAHLHPLNL